jgi:hypothetical protein
MKGNKYFKKLLQRVGGRWKPTGVFRGNSALEWGMMNTTG